MSQQSLSHASTKRKRMDTEDGDAIYTRRKARTEPENMEKIFIFTVLLPNGSNLTLTLENPDEKMSVQDFIRSVKRKCDKEDFIGKGKIKCDKEETESWPRPIQWGAQVFLEDTMGNKIKDGNIIPLAAANKVTTIILQNMWDVTPKPHLLVALPQEYSTETALADLIDNSLQAVWANACGERRLISVTIGNKEISILDSGQGMDGSKENSIAKWGTMGSSNHRAFRCEAVGGKPPYLKPYFGMYGFGGVAASMHLGGSVMVSSKTKTSKKVVTLRLEKESLMQRSKSDRVWQIPGEIRKVTQEERKMSPHGSFTKVHISSLKSQYWNENQLKCMLKDIYFPYIQNDGSDEIVKMSTPVEFEGRLPFMEPKRRRIENAPIPQQCYKRVKCFVETDAGFIPTTSKKWGEDLKQRGAKVGQYEQKLSALEKSLAALEGEIDELTYKWTSGSKSDEKIISNQGSHSVEETSEEIIRQGNNAAAVWVELVRLRQHQSMWAPSLPDVIGVVALLGKLENDLISLALSEYLGKENMMAIVCKSHKGVEQLEMRNLAGKLIPSSGIHNIANRQNRRIDGRFRVICLKDIRCYKGDFKSDDPQKQLIIEDPKLPSGNCPAGFLGYAVNMIKLIPDNLYSSASPGVGLRETLFFNLLSYVQVYETRNHMMQAISCIEDGAISLDGGMVRQRGVIECGNRNEVAVRFPTTSSEQKTSLKQHCLLIEEKLNNKMKEKKILEDKIEQTSTALAKSKGKT